MKRNIASAVRELIEQKLNDIGYDIWDVTFYKEGQEQILEVEIDGENGFSIDDCQKASDLINEIVDEADPIEQSYSLLVSGAGLTRVLRSDAHLSRARDCGWSCTAKLFTSVSGSKEITGSITGFNPDTITVGDAAIDRKQISRLTAIIE